MKKILISMLAMVAMVGCSNENDPIDDAKDQPVEIKMSAGVLNVSTKTTGVISGTQPAVSDVVFYKVDVVGSTAPSDWTDGKEFAATIAAASGAIAFTGDVPYYQANAANHSFLTGYHPGSITENGASVDKSTKGSIIYSINGNQDIMYAAAVNGNKSTSSNLTPTFTHKLAQIIVKIKGDNGGKGAWGTISKIELKDAAKSLTLNLGDGTLTGTGTNSLEIIKEGSTYPVIPELVTEEAIKAGIAMVLPQKAQYTLAITTEHGTKDVKIDIPSRTASEGVLARETNETLAGESYTITLTFKSTEIGMTASITDWQTGAADINGDVD